MKTENRDLPAFLQLSTGIRDHDLIFSWHWQLSNVNYSLLNCQLWKCMLHLMSLNLKFSLKISTFSLEFELLEVDFRIGIVTFNGHSRPPYIQIKSRRVGKDFFDGD